MSAKTFWLSRSVTSDYSVAVSRSKPTRKIGVRKFDSWGLRIDRPYDYYVVRPVVELCPNGLYRATGLKIKRGDCVKVKLVRVES